MLIKEIQVMKKMSWVEREGTASCKPLLTVTRPQLPASASGFDDAIVRSGREWGADAGIEMLPALDYLPFGVQGQNLNDLYP